MIKLLAIFVVLIALMGCDEGQQMMKPVMQPIIEDAPIPEEPISEVVFKPEPPTREEPVDFQPLDTDRVFYYEVGYLTGKLIFDDAGSATKSEEVKSVFVLWEEWIGEWCGKAEQLIPDSSPTLLFTNRQARVDFLLALPGKYNNSGGLENTDKESSADDSLFGAIGYVAIVEGTPYYGMSLNLNSTNACKPGFPSQQ